EQFDYHLENVQQDLDSLQEMLNGEGYTLDINPLDGLFGDSSEILSYPLDAAAAAATTEEADGNIGLVDKLLSDD
uniref:Uncharacterized protein n=1 Tax=Phlebotomus papatasi TaxID=29031 RepID=A0A1B0GNE1_PHLPP